MLRQNAERNAKRGLRGFTQEEKENYAISMMA